MRATGKESRKLKEDEAEDAIARRAESAYDVATAPSKLHRSLPLVDTPISEVRPGEHVFVITKFSCYDVKVRATEPTAFDGFARRWPNGIRDKFASLFCEHDVLLVGPFPEDKIPDA